LYFSKNLENIARKFNGKLKADETPLYRGKRKISGGHEDALRIRKRCP
jgi:hypothetical protein